MNCVRDEFYLREITFSKVKYVNEGNAVFET